MVRTLGRRLISLALVLIGLPVLVVLTPVAVAIFVVLDLATGLRKLPSVRLWLFAIVFLIHEWLSQIAALGLWISGGLGRRLNHAHHRAVQSWWTGSLLQWARRLLNVQLDLGDVSTMPGGEVVVLSRHASMVDAVLPAHLFANKLGRPCHYVMKKELRWLPSIDVFGHRLGNHFVDRSGDRAKEVADIARLATHAQPGAALVIFPEGTYATPESKARVQASLERRNDERGLALNAGLRLMLPPQPAGSLALFAERPDAPVVILGHVGLEGLAKLSGLRQHLPATSPVVVRWWVTERNQIPDSIQWLDEQWLTLDRWVQDQLE